MANKSATPGTRWPASATHIAIDTGKPLTWHGENGPSQMCHSVVYVNDGTAMEQFFESIVVATRAAQYFVNRRMDRHAQIWTYYPTLERMPTGLTEVTYDGIVVKFDHK